MKKLLTLLAGAVVCLNSFAQTDPARPLPTDPALRTGKLSNGFTYYIYHNEEPKERADFYIIYSVGALQEEENQNGLAHFLEHMAFNGSTNFPGGNSESTSIVKTLERRGVAFGRNINAYTAQDRTVYYLNDVITTDPALIDTCLLVLHDWASSLTLGEEEIDGERGVISEEWRTRNTASARIRKQWTPILFGDTKWATHDVIGSLDIINHFDYDELRAFYKKWYYPDNQAVAVVGDIDVDEVEKEIVRIFSAIPSPENPPVKTVEKLPENDEPLFALATDKDQNGNQLQILLPQEAPADRTYGTYRDSFVQMFYNNCLRARISELLTMGGGALVSGSASFSSLMHGYDAYVMSAVAVPGKEYEALKALYTEVVRAKRFGFTAGELDRIKISLDSSLDEAYKRKDKISNSSLAGDLVETFAYGSPFISFEDDYTIAKQFLKDITLEDVNAYAAVTPEFRNVRIVAIAPEGQDSYPDREGVLAALAEVDADSSIAPYTENDFSKGLIDKPLPGGRIVREKVLPVFGARQWTLSNGAKVVYARAGYDKEKVSMTAFSDGGMSLVPTELLAAGMLSEKLTQYCGIGRFNTIDLKKALAGKNASVTVDISETRESVSGSCRTGDFETMMQELYLTFTEPRADSVLFSSTVERLAAITDMSKGTPDKIKADTLTVLTKNYSPRAIHVNATTLRSARLEDVERIFRDRICDASDFTFIIVGDVDEQTVRSNVEKYIGSIPSIHRKETFVNHNLTIPEGHTRMTVPLDFATPKATVNLIWANEMKMTIKDILAMTVLKNIMALRYTADIREKEGGTYGVSSSLNAVRRPVKRFTYQISFDTDVAKAGHLRELVLKEIDDFLSGGVTESEIENVVKTILKNREQSRNHNSFVSSAVYSYVSDGVDTSDPKNYEDILRKLKPADIKKIGTAFFADADLLDIVFTNP